MRSIIAFWTGLIDDLQGGPARLEDCDANVPLTLECLVFGETEGVAIEPEGLVEVVDLHDETELDHTLGGLVRHDRGR